MSFTDSAIDRGHDIVGVGFSYSDANIVTPNSIVMASITEVDSNGHPFQGLASLRICNVVPDFNQVLVRCEILWESDVTFRVSIFIA